MSKEIVLEIDRHLSLIEDSLAWAKKYGRETFPEKQFKVYRRRLRTIRNALHECCSAAAYGESQVGKSYLMSSLLSSSDRPFVISNDGKEYSFIDAVNPSGGNNTRVESTGVVTRFTVDAEDDMSGYVRVRLLSVVDIILLLTDAYYNDVRVSPSSQLTTDVINDALEGMPSLRSGQPSVQTTITEDDIYDIGDYVRDVIGGAAAAIVNSRFFTTVAPRIVTVPYSQWCDLFSLLWNRNAALSRLFTTLINEYKKVSFSQEVYVPFAAVLRDRGTLLKIEWLDSVCGISSASDKDDAYTNIYNKEKACLAQNFHKGYLSALIAELTFTLPPDIQTDRQFLSQMDLLDFPGARSREKFKEEEIARVLPTILRRGKVAYLFSKYSRTKRISAVLFCHHNDQKAEATIGDTISEWIDNNIGATAEERQQMLQDTAGIAPLFLIATKFNSDLKHLKTDTPSNLSAHWQRFDTVIPEIVAPATWLDRWVTGPNNTIVPFQNIYPLRDFYWSRDNMLFVGYRDTPPLSPETGAYRHDDFPDYLLALRASFVANAFVQKHFSNPSQTWDDVATVNNDGSKAIIRNLTAIAGVLDAARTKKYLAQARAIQRAMCNALQVFFEPESGAERNEKVRKISSGIRSSLVMTVARNPAVFGQIIDQLMVPIEDLRNIAYDIVVCHSEMPRDFSDINFIRGQAGINPLDPKEANLQRLCDYFMCDLSELESYCEKHGVSLDDLLCATTTTATTIGDVVTKNLLTYWVGHLHSQTRALQALIPYSDEVVFMLINLFNKLNLRRVLTQRINLYCKQFATNELPNVIADFASLTLNNFISSVGREHINKDDLAAIRQKAQLCSITIDVAERRESALSHDLKDALRALDQAASEVNKANPDMSILRQLPFWGSFQQWETGVLQGLVYTSDVLNVDPQANAAIKTIIDTCENLYPQP